MNLNCSYIRAIGLLIASLLLLTFISPLLAEPRSPLPPWPEANPIAQLKWDAFLSPMWDGSTSSFGAEGATLVESWSGYALQRDALSGAPVVPFVMPGVTEKGKANLGFQQGCVRFWFAPSWSSGAGRHEAARLAEWMVTDGKEVETLWTLSVNESGTVISLASEGADVMKVEIAWKMGEWHQVALSYSEKGTALVIDGVLAAEGAGLMAVEPKISGLVIGSDWQGVRLAGGLFDEVLCFAEPMSVEDVAFNFRGVSRTAALGPLSAEESAEFNAPMTEGMDGGVSFARLMFDESNPCPTNGQVFMTNLWCEMDTNGSWTMTFDVAGGDAGILYDVFATTNLAGGTATNGAWYWLTNAYQCTTVILTNQPEFMTLYILGTPQDDDADGLTTAFEQLVSATDAFDADTDNDGIPDGWEWNHGMNPHDAGDATDDPDGDWLTNYQEYSNGSNPNDVMVLAWGVDSDGQLTVPLNLRNVATVDGGLSFNAAIQKSGTVASWGSATNILAGLTDVRQLSATWNQVVAVRSNGLVAVWGFTNGVPANLTNAVMVAAGEGFDLALRSDGTVTAWGTNNSGQCNVPTNLPSVTAVAAGWDHAVVLLANGTVRAWGNNYGGFDWNVTNVPAGLSNVMAITAGGYHTLALKTDGTVVAWGAGLTTNGNSGYFGAEWGQAVVPIGLSNVVSVSAGGYHSMALKADGTVVVWGDLGAFPIAAAQGQITAINSGELHAIAVRGGRLTPCITLQPESIVTLPGSNVSFNTLAIGLTNVFYQWRLNGTNILGATNTTLTVNNVQSSDLGNYTAVISNGAGSVTTSNASLTFLQPPTILSTAPTAPGNYVMSNLNFSLSVVASTPPGFTNYFQWYQGGILISNATATNYSVSWGKVGDYTVKVWNVVGTNTSAAWTISNFPNGPSLFDALWAEWAARTNAGRGYQSGWHWVWQNADAVGDSSPAWNTNSILFKDGTLATRATAIEYWNEASLPAGNAGLARFTMLTKRIGVTAGHVFAANISENRYLTNPVTTSSNLVFIGTNNVKHKIAIQAIVGGWSDWTLMGGGTNAIEDRAYVLLSNNIPDDIEVMRIATPFAIRTNQSGGVATADVWAPYVAPTWGLEAFPGFTVCQHFCVGRHNADTHSEYTDGTPIGFHVGGDSGSPAFIILSNECFYTGGWTYEQSSGDMVKAVQVINAWAGLDTNSPANQLQFYSLTNFPPW